MQKRFRVLMALAYNDPLYNQGIIEYAKNAGWELDMTTAYYGTEPSHWRGDGIITHYLATRPLLMQWIRRQKVPVVSINADEVSYWPGTAPDHFLCAKLAADHFLTLGFTNCAFFRCSDQISIKKRQEFFLDTIENNGGKGFLLDWRKQMAKKSSISQLGRMIKKIPKPLGILCQSDHRAATLFNACEEAGLRIPDDVAILAVGNNEILCKFARIPLSSVDTDMKRIAREGASLLDDLMRDKKIPEKPVIFPPLGIIQRQSTLAVQIDHPFVAKALRFIMMNSHQMINVNDVVRHVGISRAGLCRNFERIIGRSISEEILRIRLSQAKNLLLTTNDKIYEIALSVGFSSYIHFAKSFRRSENMTVTEFIEQHKGNQLTRPEISDMR